MEPPNHEIMTRLLKEHPLPWTAVRDFDGASTGQSYILDANNEQVMRITTGIKTHRKAIDLLMYIVHVRIPELANPEPTGNAVLDGLMHTYGGSSAEHAARQKWLERQGIKQYKPGFPGPCPEPPV